MLNEALQKTGIKTRVWFNQVQCVPLGFILALLTKKANRVMFISSKSNLLIWAAKSIDEIVVEVEVLE